MQRDLANAMGKTEAEISKWLCGFHNFTIKTISKIEAVWVPKSSRCPTGWRRRKLHLPKVAVHRNGKKRMPEMVS